MKRGTRASLWLVAAIVLTLTVPAPVVAAPVVDRVAGEDRIDTAVRVSRTAFADGATHAVVADSQSFADALAAAPLAAAVGGPVLLNTRDTLDPRVADELERLGVQRVFLMGGEAAQGPAVATALAVDHEVTRLGGRDRFATAAEAASAAVEFWRDAGDESAGDHVIVALGRHPTDVNRAWPDALTAGVLAGYAHRPILLTDRDTVPSATNDTLRALGTSVVTIVGGRAAVPDDTMAQVGDGVERRRIGGVDRYDTGRLLAAAAEDAGADGNRVLLATGTGFADSLGAGPAAVALGGVLLLVHPADLDHSPATSELLWQRRETLTRVTLVGGEGAIPGATGDQIAARSGGPGELTLTTELLGTFDQPLGVVAPRGDDRVFVFTRGTADLEVGQTLGRVWLVRDGVVDPAPFLEVPTRIDAGYGLLGFTFHPAFPADPRVFAHHTDAETGATLISEYRLSADPDRADPASQRVVLRTTQPSERHNGGTLTFGPDGMLYLFLGQGDDAPSGAAQDTSNHLGSILRLDVSTPGTAVAAADNPFVGAGGDDNIWHYGLRNPFRGAFDRVTGVGLVADVGEDAVEEVDLLPVGVGGLNFGWPCREGSAVGPRPADCEAGADLTDPILEYARDGGNCGVIGGDFYRGEALGALRGHWFYGDICSGLVASVRVEDGLAVDHRDWTTDIGIGGVRSFGLDGHGELYVMDDAEVLRIVAG